MGYRDEESASRAPREAILRELAEVDRMLADHAAAQRRQGALERAIVDVE